MEKTLRIGMIGAGRISKVHTPNLVTRVPRARVTKLVDINLAAAHALADPYHIPISADYHDLLKDPEIDAVFICSSTDTHVDISLQAAKAGKHVFCEKPIDHDAEAIRRVIEAVNRAGIKYQVGFNRRFDKNFWHLKQEVEAGRVGQVQIIKITSRDPEAPPLSFVEKSGGIFADMTIHDFDMVQYLSGSLVREVAVMGACLVNPEIAKFDDVDTCVISMKLDNGALAVIDNSRQAVYGYDQRIEVFGSKGCVSAQNEFPNNTRLMTGQGVYTQKPLWFFLERYTDAFIYEEASFVEACLDDKPTLIDALGGLSPVLIADAAKQSHKRGGMPVRVES